jgi:hypothetical protein
MFYNTKPLKILGCDLKNKTYIHKKNLKSKITFQVFY